MGEDDPFTITKECLNACKKDPVNVATNLWAAWKGRQQRTTARLEAGKIDEALGRQRIEEAETAIQAIQEVIPGVQNLLGKLKRGQE